MTRDVIFYILIMVVLLTDLLSGIFLKRGFKKKSFEMEPIGPDAVWIHTLFVVIMMLIVTAIFFWPFQRTNDNERKLGLPPAPAQAPAKD